MKTLRTAPIALLGLVLAIALLGSSCSSTNPVALQVGEWQLSNSTLQDQLNSFADVYAKATSQAQADQRLRGTTNGTWSTDFTAQFLNDQASLQLAQLAVQDRGLEVTQGDLDNARTQLEQNYATSSGQSVFGELDEAYQQTLVEGVAAQTVLSAALQEEDVPDELLRQLYDAASSTYSQPLACVSHILVLAGSGNGQTTPTDAEYAAALTKVQQLENGLTVDNFATVATASSEDPGSAPRGGDLGCAPEGSYVTEFDQVAWSQEIGVISPPVKTDFGYHLILVRQRGVLTFDDVKDQLLEQVKQNPDLLLQQELARMARKYGVTVDGRYGSVNDRTGQISPPEGPLQPTTTLAVDPLAGTSGTSGAQ